MALLTDGMISSIEDLTGYDSAVLDVARVEGINLAQKLELAQEEIALEVRSFLLHQSGWRSLPGEGGAPRAEQVVVNPALKRWHALQTLALFYTDAVHSQLNDRYRGKLKQIRNMARSSRELLFLTGVGLIAVPVPRAPVPEVWTGAAGGLSGAFLVGIQWVDSQGRVGAPSGWAHAIIHESGSIHVSARVEAPAGVVGYHVYVRTPEIDHGQQTGSPVELGTNWMTTGPLSDGPQAGDGQKPEFLVRLSRVLPRG
jgi:hypothetical protein